MFRAGSLSSLIAEISPCVSCSLIPSLYGLYREATHTFSNARSENTSDALGTPSNTGTSTFSTLRVKRAPHRNFSETSFAAFFFPGAWI